MKTVIVIPARYQSSRLPGKPLLDETGWPMIRHVYEQAKQSKLASRVLVATDDSRIMDAVAAFGGEAVMTSSEHPSGTDRLAEVAERYVADYDLVVNVQGDEPEIEPEKIDQLITLYETAGDAAMATLVWPFPAERVNGAGSVTDPACCKAVLGKPVVKNGAEIGREALYFSRAPIPYPRDNDGVIADASGYYLHLGIYAYAPEFLKRYVAMPMGRLEQIEKLEQLRVLENGYKIVAGIVDTGAFGVDTPEDYRIFVQRWKEKGAQA